MVFCGKPSKGCTNCRIRRIKCDQLDPACSQCLRVGKECPGYRDQLSLMFRDENEKVLSKVHVQKSKSKHQNRPRNHKSHVSVSPSESEGPSSSHSQAIISYSPLSTFALPFLEDEGIKFFFDTYVTVAALQPESESDLDSAPKFPLICHESLFDVISSVGFAGLSNVTRNPKHMITARKKYAKCLRDITRALADVANSDLDATFKSVILLAVFEIVNCSSLLTGLGSLWGVHIDGGAAILGMMTPKRPKFLSEQRMWIQFVFAVYIKCLSRGEEAPPDIHKWTESCRQEFGPRDDYAVTLANIIWRFTNLKASFKSNSLIDSKVVLLEALSLNLELETWEASLPKKWRYTTKPAPATMRFVYNGQMHEYHDFWTARILHNWRWARILVNELLLVHMAQLRTFEAEDEEQRKRSLEIISRTATDICTGVSGSFFPYKILHAEQKNVPAVSGVFVLLFPLAVAGSAMGVSDELYDWVMNILDFIGNQMGISQALAMRELVASKRNGFKVGRNSYHVLTAEHPVSPARA